MVLACSQGSGAALVEPVDQHEAGEDRHEEQRRHQQHAEHEEQRLRRPGARRLDARARRQRRRVEGAGVARRRAAPDAPGRHGHAVGQRGLAFQVAAPPDPGVAFQDRRRSATQASSSSVMRPEQQAAALDARVLEVDGVADADACRRRRAGRARAASSSRSRRRAPMLARPARAATRRTARSRPADRSAPLRPGGRPATSGNRSCPTADRNRASGGRRPATCRPTATTNSSSVASRNTPIDAAIAQRHRVARVAGEEVVGEERRQPLRHAQRDQHRHGGQLGQAAAPSAAQRDGRRPVGFARGGAGGLRRRLAAIAPILRCW